MKALIVFTVLVLVYTVTNMVQSNVNAATYKDGIQSYLEFQQNNVKRGPAIVKNK